jgi:hypothetical protein
VDIGDEVESYLRGHVDFKNFAAYSWDLEHNDGVWTLSLHTENGPATLCMDKGGLQDLVTRLEREYYKY